MIDGVDVVFSRPMINYYLDSHRGKVRPINEDRVARFEDELFVVADGVGGLPQGEVAAQRAIDEVLKTYRGRRSVFPESRVLQRVFAKANEAVYQGSLRLARRRGFPQRMATTLVVAIVDEDGVYIGHVGDSRAYRFSGSCLVQLTQDHLFRGGGEDEAVLGKVIGGVKSIEPSLRYVDFLPGDTILLCTDGLHQFIDEAEIARIITRQETLKDAGEQLIAAALTAGGLDNITVCLIRRNDS